MSRFRSNVPSEDNESYYCRAIGIPVMNALMSNLNNRMADRSQTKPFSLLPKVCLSPQFNFENSVACFLQSFRTDLPSGKKLILFWSEIKRWIRYCQRIEKKKENSKKTERKKQN